MNDVAGSNRYAPPTARVDDVDGGGQALAGRGIRLGAAMIDVVIALTLVWIAGRLTTWSAYQVPPDGQVIPTLAINLVLGFSIFLLVHGYLLATRGQTVGKLLLGIRIVRTNGEAACFARLAGLRYGLGYAVAMIPFVGGLYGLVDSLLIFRASHQCLHDTIADTIVVRR